MNTKSIIAVSISCLLGGCIATRLQEFAAQVPAQGLPQSWHTDLSTIIETKSTSLKSLVASPELHALLELALKDNPSLREIALRLQEAYLSVDREYAGLSPQASVSSEIGRTQDAETKISREKPENSLGLSLSVTWEADVWGRLRHRVLAQEQEAKALAEDVRAARALLVGKIMRTWIDKAVTDRIVAVETLRIRSLRIAETVILERYENGIGDIGDLDAAQSATASAEATLFARLNESARYARRLQVLAGQLPNDGVKALVAIPDVLMPDINGPAAVVGYRPDLRAAYARLRAADQEALYTYKDILPHFHLSGTLEKKGSSLPNLLRFDPAWALISALSATVFDAGQRKAQTQIAETTAHRYWELYRSTLLTALEEVENALAFERSFARQIDSRILARKHAKAAFQYQTEKYVAGLSDVVSLLTSERTAFDAEIAVLEVQQQRLCNRVNLALALGFDYEGAGNEQDI